MAETQVALDSPSAIRGWQAAALIDVRKLFPQDQQHLVGQGLGEPDAGLVLIDPDDVPVNLVTEPLRLSGAPLARWLLSTQL